MSRVLVAYWHPPGVPIRSTVERHLHVLDDVYDDVVYHNAFFDFPKQITTDAYDAIVLHNTLLCMRWSEQFVDYALRCEWIAARRCVKIGLPQDEYDHHEVLDEWLYALDVTHVFSNFGKEAQRILYPILCDRVEFATVLTGYIDSASAIPSSSLEASHERPLDIVYRSSDLPYWFGRQGQLKVELGTVVRNAADARGLRVDISSRPEDTLYGASWAEFLASSRATIGCQTGSSALDHRGEIQARIRWLEARTPNLSFAEVSARLPAGWDDHAFFAIGPRHLEAVAAGTAQILVEGDYSGVLVAGRHYIPLARDFSNLEAALDVLEHPEEVAKVARHAYEDVYESGRYTYSTLAELLVRAIGEPVSARRSSPGSSTVRPTQ